MLMVFRGFRHINGSPTKTDKPLLILYKCKWTPNYELNAKSMEWNFS